MITLGTWDDMELNFFSKISNGWSKFRDLNKKFTLGSKR